VSVSRELARTSKLKRMSSLSFAVVGPRGALGRVVWPLACSLAIHLGLGAIAVLAGSVELPWQQPPRAVWLDLEPVVIPAPPAPAPPASVTPPRPVRPPAVEPRKIPASSSQVSEQLVAPPLPSPPAREVTAPEPPAQAPPSPPQTAVAVESLKPSEPDRSGTPPSIGAGEKTPTDTQPSRVAQERAGEGAGRSAVASRTPDSAPGGPIVRAARPKGGYQVRPVYPESARRAGIQGTTLLRIHIEVDGHVSDVSVQRSAGHQSLDEAAADAVRRWRFEPALNSAGPVSMWAVVPVEFRIGDRD
jgi:protein TonB